MIHYAFATLASLFTPLLVPAWRPLLDPLDLHAGWLLLLPPLVLAIALVYKALKMPTLDRFPVETAKLTAYILALMALAATGLWALVEWL